MAVSNSDLSAALDFESLSLPAAAEIFSRCSKVKMLANSGTDSKKALMWDGGRKPMNAEKSPRATLT